MALEIADTEKELFRLVVYGHVNSGFEPLSDYARRLHEYPMGYPFPKGVEVRKKVFVTDLNGVWNIGHHIFYGYLKELSRWNKGVEHLFDHILKIVKDIKPGYIDEPVRVVSEIFRACDVRKWQHGLACGYAIDEIDLIPYGLHCLAELRAMRYDIYCFSGSPDKVVKRFVEERMRLPAERGHGSVYNFESDAPDAKFESIGPLIYEYKRPAVEKVLKEVTGSARGMSHVLSDEPDDIEMVTSFVNTFIIVDSTEDIPEEKDSIVINLPEFREDPRILPSKLKKIERALCFQFGYTQEEKERIFSSALGFKKCSEFISSAENEDLIGVLKRKTLEYYNDYKAAAWKIFPLFLSDIENLADRFENATTTDEIKSASRNFWDEFRQHSPDADIAEIYYNLL